MKQLLVEYLPFTIPPQILKESVRNDGSFIVEGVIQRANAKNQNGRVYPKYVLEREFEKYIKGPVAERRSLGELDHPESAVINLKNVSHLFTEIWWKGDDVWGKMEILGENRKSKGTPQGNILKALFLEGITVGVSSRGMGSIKPLDENTVEVQDDFELLCIDCVSTPSTHGSFMKRDTPNLKEGKIHQTYNPKYDDVNKLITEILCNRIGYCECDLPYAQK